MPIIYTIGYGNREFAEFANIIQAHGIETLVDVRTAPYSTSRPEFNHAAIKTSIRKYGANYRWAQSLGGKPLGGEMYTAGRLDPAKCEASPSYRKGIRTLKQIASEGVVMLMCRSPPPATLPSMLCVGRDDHQRPWL